MAESVHLLGKNSTPIGVLSKPDAGKPRSDLAVIFLNSGLLHRVGPFRLYVSLARRLATQGVASVRIDQSGKGDSERRKGLSFIDSIRKDFEDTAAFLETAAGARRFVVLGLCSGADDALYLAAEYPQIAGAALLEAYAFRTPSYYLRHYGPRLVRADVWSAWAGRAAQFAVRRLEAFVRGSKTGEDPPEIGAIRDFVGGAEMQRRYRAVVERGGKLLCVFTDGSRSYYNYRGQLAGYLRLGEGTKLVTEAYLPSAKHTYPLSAHREQAMDEVCRWIAKEFPAAVTIRVAETRLVAQSG